jgi:UDP-glucose 4-epimerase
MATILVTGAAGFIGSHVVDALIAQGHRVLAFDDLSGGFSGNVHEQAQFIQGSITDEKLVNHIFDQNDVEYVFHLGAYAAENLSHFIRKYNYENNVIGSIHLINAAIKHNIKCFVFTSSIAAYGDIPSPMKEEDHPRPCDPYGIAKLAVELDLQSAHKIFGLNYIIFKPHNVYGPRQNMEDKYRNVVTIFINQMMQNKPVTVFGDGEQTRSFSFVTDVAQTIAKSINVSEAYNKSFNIGADESSTVNQLAQVIAGTLDVAPNVVHLQERKEVKHAHADHTKVKELLGYNTSVTLAEGIAQTVAWAATVGKREQKEFTNVEIKKNLPDGW